MRSIRTLPFVLEAATLIVVVGFVYLMLFTLEREVRYQYVQRQYADLEKIELTIKMFLDDRRRALELADEGLFMARPGAVENFSDMVLLDSDLRITRVLWHDESSQIFEGYHYSERTVGALRAQLAVTSVAFSSVVRSPENEKLGLYAMKRFQDGYLLARIGLDQLNNYMLRISEIMGATIIVASPDGFVYVCTDPTLSLSVVPEADGDIVSIDREYLFTSRRSAQLNQNLIVLSPRDDVLAVLDSFKIYYPLFIIAFLLIIGGKVAVQHIYIINPLQKFLVLMNRWNFSSMDQHSASGTAILRTKEIQDLYHTFVQKSLSMQAALHEVQNKEEEMRRIRSYLKNIIDSMPSMLISIDEKGMVQEWNSAAQYFTGVSADRAVGQPFWDVYPELARYRHLCEQVIETGINRELKKEMIENGSRMYVNISLFPLVANGVKGMAIRLDDVTRIEHIEEQLRQAQKMETIGTLAGGLAHDFNNVLGGIVGTLSLMQYRLDTTADLNPHRAEIEKELKTLNDSSSRAAQMISQLLTLSRKHTVEFKPVDLCDVIRNVENIARNSFDKSVEIVVGHLPEKAVTRSDPAQIEQVVLNLAVNGAHAMTIMRDQKDKSGGTLGIFLEQAEATGAFVDKNPGASAGGSYWVLSVQDAGVGMNPEVQEKIFDPFFTTKDKGRGTGLGLAMVYNIVRQHGGFINVYSEPGTGSIFRLYLPVADEDAPAKTVEQKKVLRRGRGRILIVDDEQVIRDLAKSILEECGYDVVTASNGDEAVIEFRMHADFDLVLLDMAMPRKSGIDTYMELKSIREDVRVLLSSGFRADERVALALERGVAGFIQKPYTMDVLAEEVGRILGEPNQQ